MSLSTLQNPNRGPLKLEHDITPRDIAKGYNKSTDFQSTTHYNPGYGYRGFPLSNFERSRHQNVEAPQQETFGVAHHLDTSRPLVTGHSKGFQYGSELPKERQSDDSRQIGRIATKTSAELSRFRDQQEEAQYNIQQFKKDRQQKFDSRETEKKEDMEMLKAYHPWGKPGGGAPASNQDSPRMSQIQDALKEEYGDFNAYFGRPGHGAALRTDSGKIKTELKANNDIRFQNSEKGRKVYEQELRYKAEGSQKMKYSSELEKQVQVQKQKAQEDRLDNLRKELEMLQHDPYNKPGGGAPNKTRSGLQTITGRRITLSHDVIEKRKAYKKHEQDIEIAALNRANSEFEMYDPWGKGVGQPQRDNHGDITRHRYSDGVRREVYTEAKARRPPSEENGTSLDIERARGGGGAPIITSSGNLRTRKIISMKKNETGDSSVREDMPGYNIKPNSLIVNDPDFAIYDPFSRPGAGAPLRNEAGEIKTSIYGNLKNVAGERNLSSGTPGRKEAAKQYLNELQLDMLQQKRKNAEIENHMKEESDGIADIMKRSQVGKPRRDHRTGLLMNQHLGRTDVTLGQTQERSVKNDQSAAYHTELEQAAMERKKLHALDNLKDRQEAKQHSIQMNTFWGRPGCGAPTVNGAKKANLNDILYSPRKEKDYRLMMPYAVNIENTFIA